MYKILIFFVLCFFLIDFTSAQIINIEELRIRGTNDSVQWYGHVNFAANLTKVTQTVSQLRADAQLEWKKKRHIILSLTNYNFVKAGNKNFVNSGFQHLRYNYKIKSFLTWECFGQIQENQIQLINLRMIAGTGLRYRLFRKHEGKSRAYVGVAYMAERNDYKNEEAVALHRISSYFSITYKPTKTFSFQNTTYFQPEIWRWNQLRWSSELDLDFKISSKLSFLVGATIGFDATLLAGIPKQSLSLLNGLKWKL